MTQTDIELARITRDAILTASRKGSSVAVYNLNSAGRRLLVIRDYKPQGCAPYAGPFEPQPLWSLEFPDYPAAAIPALPDGWSDCSWHNDACPSFMHEATGLHLFAGYPAGHASAFDDAPRFTFAQCITRTDGAGWQLDSDAVTVLECDTIGEVRDLLDSLPYCDNMAEALRSARMRLDQLTPADARALISIELQHADKGGKACPDLIGAMLELMASDAQACTIEGEPARLRLAGRFGFVRRADGKFGEVEFSISAIASVLAKGGAFKS